MMSWTCSGQRPAWCPKQYVACVPGAGPESVAKRMRRGRGLGARGMAALRRGGVHGVLDSAARPFSSRACWGAWHGSFAAAGTAGADIPVPCLEQQFCCSRWFRLVRTAQPCWLINQPWPKKRAAPEGAAEFREETSKKGRTRCVAAHLAIYPSAEMAQLKLCNAAFQDSEQSPRGAEPASH
jgi:hypothetical protein